MNAILGFSELMEMLLDKQDQQDLQKSNLDHIQKAGEHLLNLIDEVLDLAHIESGELKVFLEPVDIVEIKNELINLMSPLANKNEIQIIDNIDKEASSFVRADRIRLKQVLLNLISNAIKYNKPNGTVTLSQIIKKKSMTFKVEDTGYGIPKDRQVDIFKPFERLGAENSEVKGTGIGLSISKTLTELMGGTLDFKSRVEKGSGFYVKFPVETNPLTENLSDKTSKRKIKKGLKEKLILYIEDNPDNLELVKRALIFRESVKLISAPAAEIGIDLAKNYKPDLILLDIQLPGMDGFTAFKRLKELNETGDIPVIALSADAMKINQQKAIDYGFLDYITKPIRVGQFLNKIDEVLN